MENHPIPRRLRVSVWRKSGGTMNCNRVFTMTLRRVRVAAGAGAAP